MWYLAGLLLIWSFAFTMMRGSDLWWHLAAGRWMTQNHAFLFTDPGWAFTAAGQPWLNDAWLSDLIYYNWTQLFGVESLVWWKWSVIVVTHLLLMRMLHRLTGEPLAAFAGAVSAAAVASAFLDIRPHLYSYLGYVLALNLILGRKRPSWGLPVVLLVWANLHAISVFGFGAVMALLAYDAFQAVEPRAFDEGGLFGIPGAVLRVFRRDRRRLAMLLACVGAFMLNPHGIYVITRPFRYALTSSPFRNIGEWQPPFNPGGIESAAFPYFIGVFLFSSLAVIALSKKRGVPWAEIGLGVLTLCMALKSRRFVPLFGLSQSLVLARSLAIFLYVPKSRLAYLLPVLALVVGLYRLQPFPIRLYAFHYLMAEDTFPVDMMDFVETNHLQGRVFGYYNWGGYIHWRTNGRLQVYIDGRADMVFDDNTYMNYLRVLSGQPGFDGIIGATNAPYVLWPKNSPQVPSALLQSRKWLSLYEDSTSILLVRADAIPAGKLALPPDSGWARLRLASIAFREQRLADAEALFKAALDKVFYLSEAIYGLARVQAAQGKTAEAWATIRMGQKIFPYPEQVEAFQRLPLTQRPL